MNLISPLLSNQFQYINGEVCFFSEEKIYFRSSKEVLNGLIIRAQFV